MNDISQKLQQSVRAAYKERQLLKIVGGNTKAFYGRRSNGRTLQLSYHAGIVSYEPTELVITVRAGTLLNQIESVLAEYNQMLAFEPPYFGDGATIGGTIACGFSGPRRPFAGAARDFVLGTKLLNGKGEILSFGGQVMKNVAGYDVSRLMVGALGTLGILLEVSLKVLPMPSAEITLLHELDFAKACQFMSDWPAQSLPLSALCYDGTHLYSRLSGSIEAVEVAQKKLAGERVKNGPQFWQDLREHQLPFFQHDLNLWRLSVAPGTQFLNLPGDWFIDWGGAQRWLISDEPATQIYHAVETVDGHATLFRSKDRSGDVFHPLSAKLSVLHRNLKQAFDPRSILNPNRMYQAS